MVVSSVCLLFTECQDGILVELIEIDSTHYGNK